MEMKNPPPMMTEKMPTTKPPTRSAAVSRVSSQGASALIEHPVEDYASVILRSASGILGTVEVGNGFPRDGTDGAKEAVLEAPLVQAISHVAAPPPRSVMKSRLLTRSPRRRGREACRAPSARVPWPLSD